VTDHRIEKLKGNAVVDVPLDIDIVPTERHRGEIGKAIALGGLGAGHLAQPIFEQRSTVDFG
jgi:hypothetical protein